AKGKSSVQVVKSKDQGGDKEVMEVLNKNREPLSEDILGATTQRDTGSYYPKRYWELLPKEILGAITQRDTGSYYPKRDWDVLWENGGNLARVRLWEVVMVLQSKDGRQVAYLMCNLVGSSLTKEVMEVLVRYWSGCDVGGEVTGDEGGGECHGGAFEVYYLVLYMAVFGQPTVIPVIWLPFTHW
ncbi:hypothetical protein Tco_0918561, partial [Tanacetum coccineum]